MHWILDSVDDVDMYSFLHDMPKQTSSVPKSRDLPALATSTFQRCGHIYCFCKCILYSVISI